MFHRDNDLLKFRPEIPEIKQLFITTADEFFQNNTLRPVIKLQCSLLVAAFQNYVAKHKNTFHHLSIEKKLDYIENAVQKDMKFRNSLKGMIIGQFTLEEYGRYVKNSSALNKRMMGIVKERLKDNLLQFELQTTEQ